MSTATKLEYLNETKSKIKDNINLTGVNITNEDTFRSYAGKLKQGLLDILNKGNDYLYNNFPQTTGTGTNITLNNTLEAPIKSELLGNTSQNGTPTPDAPVEVINATGRQEVRVVGKNLFDGEMIQNAKNNNDGKSIITSTKYIMNKNSVRVLPNTPYTFSATFTNNTTGGDIHYLDENGDFLSRDSLAKNGTKTTPNNCYFINFQYYNSTAISPSDVISIQIEKGSTATEYEAYKEQSYEINLGNIELCKIGDYRDSIRKGTGSNLYNGLYTAKRYINYNTGEMRNSNDWSATDYIEIEPNTNYTLSGITNSGWVAGTSFYDNNKTFISSVFSTIYSFTTPENAKYLRFSMNSETPTNVMLEKGSTATDYEPYGSKGKWLLTKNIGKVVLDGSENWTYYSVAQGSLFRSNNVILDEIKNNTYVPYSKYYQGISYNNYQNRQNNQFYINSDNNFLDFIDNRYTTVNDFKNWLTTHNVSIYYVLATPTTEEITDSTLLNDLNNLEDAKSYNGTTNITITAETPADIKITALKNE